MGDQTDLLKKIAENTQKPIERSITITSPSKGDTSDFSVEFKEAIYAPENRRFEVALQNLQTFYSWPNIHVSGAKQNNTFIYSKDGGKTWITITLAEGAYEFATLASEIERSVLKNNAEDDPPITLSANPATMKAIIDINDTYYQVDIGKSKIRSLFNWKRSSGILKKGRNEAPNVIQITEVNEVLVNCDIVDESYTATGKSRIAERGSVLYSFYPNVEPGYKINLKPSNLVFLPVTQESIKNIGIKITDQEGDLLNLRGELVTVSLILRDRPQ